MIYLGNGIFSDDNPNEYLQHYGVIGMKWGVRRAREHEKNIYRHNIANYMPRNQAKAEYRARMADVKKYARENRGTGLKSRDIANRSRNEARNRIDDYDRKLKAQRKRKAIIAGLGAATAAAAGYAGYRIHKGLKSEKTAKKLYEGAKEAQRRGKEFYRKGNDYEGDRHFAASRVISRKINDYNSKTYNHGYQAGRHLGYATLLGGAATGVALANHVKSIRQMKKKNKNNK